MERLTIEYDGHYVPEKLCTVNRYGEADDCEGCGGCEGEDCDLCPVQECFERLAEYDTERIIREMTAQHCGDYDCLLPDNQINDSGYWCGGSSACMECDYYKIMCALNQWKGE